MATDERKDTALTFRAGVGIILRKPDGRLLLCERKDKPGRWSFPQGGIEPGEIPVLAAYREMGEELGIGVPLADSMPPELPLLIGVYPGFLSYLIPRMYEKFEKVGIGQTILWHLFEWSREDDPPKLGAEFNSLGWWKPSDVYTLTVSPFKIQMYRDLMYWVQELYT